MQSEILQKRWEMLQALSMQKGQREQKDGSDGLSGDYVRERLTDWLEQLVGSGEVGKTISEGCLTDYTLEGDCVSEEIKSLRVMFTLKLQTSRDTYLLMIKDASTAKRPTMGIVSVTVSRAPSAVHNKEMLDRTYGNDDAQPTLNIDTLWIENFLQPELFDALHRCATAILGNELVLHCNSDSNRREAYRSESAAVTSETLSPDEHAIIAAMRELPESSRSTLMALLKQLPRQG